MASLSRAAPAQPGSNGGVMAQWFEFTDRMRPRRLALLRITYLIGVPARTPQN